MTEQSVLAFQDDDAGGLWRAVHIDATGRETACSFSDWLSAYRWINEQRMRGRIGVAGIQQPEAPELKRGRIVAQDDASVERWEPVEIGGKIDVAGIVGRRTLYRSDDDTLAILTVTHNTVESAEMLQLPDDLRLCRRVEVTP